VDKRRFVAVALAAALGFSLWDALRGISTLITVLADDAGHIYEYSPLSWRVGGRTLTIYQLVQGLIEVVLVLLIAWWLRHRFVGDVKPAPK
jgi:hypothetical protein